MTRVIDHLWKELKLISLDLITGGKVRTKSVITEYLETVSPNDVLDIMYTDDDELLNINSAEDMIPEMIPEPEAPPPEVANSEMNVILKADGILNSLITDLDDFGDEVIYSDGFIEKLIALTQIHQSQEIIDILDTSDESIKYR